VSQPKYLQIGWAVSVGLHLVLAVIFLLIFIPIKPFVEEFAELYFQTMPASARREVSKAVPTPAKQTPTTAGKAAKEEGIPAKAEPGSLVDLPQRRYHREDELTQPVSELTRKLEPSKMDAQEVVRTVGVPPLKGPGKTLPTVQAGERETPSIDKLLSAGPRPEGPTINATPLTGTSQQPFEILWEGPSREILSGPLPEYPPGISKEVKIRLEFQVLPNGTVGLMSPVAKGETTLENIAMEALKNWRFNPLDSSQPQVIQSAVITFVFKLE
jgi:TonB family protein